MKNNFSEQELKERALDLLYGLLDENEAEELRRLIASDATAARVFDEARETADWLARAARWKEDSETNDDKTAAKNVAVETIPFDGGAPFLFESTTAGSGAFSATVAAKTERAEKSPLDETDGAETETESSGSNRKKAKRRLNLLRKSTTAAKNKRAGKSGKSGGQGGAWDDEARSSKGKNATTARLSFGLEERVDGASGWATVGRTSSGGRRSAARRLWSRLPKPTLFQNLIIALAFVALSTLIGFWAQETALQARFRDEFRVQIAASRTLARGESQTIAATTTGPNGKPRRVPIRFSFSDAETGAPLLAHTESGNASGVARFKIPDVSAFPERTLLTISAGEREKESFETFETVLTVVDAPKANVGANAAARFAASEAVEESAVEIAPTSAARARKEERREFSFVPSTNEKKATTDGVFLAAKDAAPSPDGKMGMNALSASDDDKTAMGGGMDGGMGGANAPLALETVDVTQLYDREAPVKENAAVAVLNAPLEAEKRGLDVRFCPTGGRLVAGRENVVWFECVDEAGRPVVGEFALNDSEGRVATAKTSEGGVGLLRWSPDADETYSLETAFNGKIAKVVEVDKIVKNDKKSVGEKERAAAEETAPGILALSDVVVEDFLPPEPAFKTFRFPAPPATVERVAFSVPERVLESGKSVQFEIWAENEIPLVATVEKNGIALEQRVWTAKKGKRRVLVPLDESVSGVLNVSLWNCAGTPFEKIGSAAVYRKPSSVPTFDATIERADDGGRALRIAVDAKSLDVDAKSARLEAFWAPTLDEALASLELDETLLCASDERRAEMLGTLELPAANEPILFDNLLEMKERALDKLNAFWLGETGLAGRVVGFGFVGCAALALLTTFCVLLGALKARRGAVVVLFCAALATFFYFERRRIDFSETLSEAIAVSVDESKAARRSASDGSNGSTVEGGATAPNVAAEKATTDDEEPRLTSVPIGTADASKPTNEAEWTVPLTGPLATTDVGVILAKIVVDDGARAWKTVELSEQDDETETTER